MRRVLALAAVSAAVFAAAACTGSPAVPSAVGQPTPGTSASSTTSATTPPPTADPNVTKQVCTDATAAAADGTKVFNEQIGALETAAAKGDQTTMVSSAEVIQKKLVELAASLKTLSQKSVTPAVKTALTDASSALTEIASESYTGSPQDIQKKLTDLAGTFAKACT
jgi:hypothetical protein